MADLHALYTQRAAQSPSSATLTKSTNQNTETASPFSEGAFSDLLFTLQAPTTTKGAALENTAILQKAALPLTPILPTPELTENAEVPAQEQTQENAPLPDIFAGLLINQPQSDNQRNISALTGQAASLTEQGDIQERLVNNGIPELIVSDLTPEQLEALNNLSDEDLKKISAFDLVALGIGLPATSAQSSKAFKDLLTKTIAPAKTSDGIDSIDAKKAAQLNSLEIGAGLDSSTEGDENFDNVLRQLSSENTEGDADIDLSALRASSKDSPANFGDYLKAINAGRVQAGATLINGSVPDSLVSFDPSAAANSFDSSFTLGGLQNGGQAAQIQALAKANIAQGANPVTGVIAATLTKAANGTTKDLTVQLNPPELGRVNVKIEVNKDKSLKAVLTIEKPETYLLLQKDQATLQQTLQSIGLSSGGELSFQLGHDGAFDRHPDQNQKGNNFNSDRNSNDQILEIDTGLRWFVDPQTGITRYNLLA